MGQWKFDGVDLDSVATDIEVIPLASKQTAININDMQIPGYQLGGVKKRLRTRSLLLLLWLKQAEKSLEYGDNAQCRCEDILVQLFGKDGAHTLEQMLDLGCKRIMTCEIVDTALFTSVSNNLLGYTVKLTCPDPYWYNPISAAWSADINASTFIGTIVNLSPVTVSNVRISLTGRISDPVIENLTTGNRIKINTKMRSNDTVSFNCGLRTCCFNTLNDCSGLDADPSCWFAICPGINKIKVASEAAPSAHIEIEYETPVVSRQ